MRMTPARVAAAAALAGTTVLAAATGPAAADNGTDTSALREAVTVEAIDGHLAALQAAADANDDNRAAGTPGYDASAEYVTEQLEAAGYTVTQQPFTYERTVFDLAVLAQTGARQRGLLAGHRLLPDGLLRRRRRDGTRDRRRREHQRGPRVDQRMRDRRLRRVPGRQHRPDPAGVVQLLGQGRQRRGRRGGRGDHLQPGQRRRGR